MDDVAGANHHRLALGGGLLERVDAAWERLAALAARAEAALPTGGRKAFRGEGGLPRLDEPPP